MPIWAAVGAALVATSPWPWFALFGAVLWPFVEYSAHRWAMHGLARIAPRLYRKVHGVHHMYPDDLAHFTIPLPVVLVVVLGALYAGVPRAVVGGMLLAFVAYDLAHLAAHGLAPFPFRERLRDHHAAHHRHASVSFAVSAPFLDRLFRTAWGRREAIAEHIALRVAVARAVEVEDVSEFEPTPPGNSDHGSCQDPVNR